MDSEYSENDRGDESRDGVEIRETHPLLNDSEREVTVISVEVKPTAPPDVAEPSTSASAIRRQSQNSSSSSEDVTERAVDVVVTTEPLSSSVPPGELNNSSEPDSSFAHNHTQLKNKFDTDEPDSVEGYAHKICCNFIQCCAIFIEG